ncbi:LOW QUALITY PROTEIN: uncharacterized protein LOC117892964 [Drosophila subobscura]|uniref:LOW QUALITY PROTEIN: uncharacterized protein LOC117892964 n=1 Tax=Drosophila subobscura TaxID=7241 RepID=UPI00155AE87A|nr:LOW QUALITY PROTEIN: uncharacterized protein LOC117892964 [Drosophila subobscura]
MRLKEHPDLIFDAIPKLYESTTKVLLTNLSQVPEQLKPPPQKFCRMYTTRPLADQLLLHLQWKGANISEQDFHIVEDGKPFQLRLSDGRRLEAMLCAGTALGNSLVLLIRKLQGGKLLYFYSAVQQDDLCQVIANPMFHSWIAQGTELLYLNLSGAHRPLVHVDYDEVAADIEKLRREKNCVVRLKLPHFGYEPLVRRLGHTLLYGHIRLIGQYANSYAALSNDLRRFEEPDYLVKVHIFAADDFTVLTTQSERFALLPLDLLKWSPQPTRMNLIQLCSLLRPQHIQGIVPYHATGNVPPPPEYLQRFSASYSPQKPNAPLRAPAAALPQAAKKVDRVIRKKGFDFLSDDDEADKTDSE